MVNPAPVAERRGRGRPTDRSGEQSRHALIVAACGLFSEQGYAATTTREISEAAGMQPGNLRHHLGTKAAVFNAVFEYCMSEVAAVLAALVDSAEVRTPGGYVRLLGTLLDDAPEVMAFLAIAPLERRRHVDLRKADGGVAPALEALVRGTIRSWAVAGRVSAEIDPDALADALIAATFGYLVYATSVDPNLDRPSVVEALARLIDGSVWSLG